MQMCLSSTPSAPKPPPMLPEAPTAPDANASMTGVDEDARRRRAAAGTGNGTILTGSRGVTSTANTSSKTLLGA
jgi:hypothetical protein